MRLNIKDKLNEKNMTRYELAKRIGVTYPTISAIYNGDSTSIKLDILEALCHELDCTPNEIVVSEDETVKNSIEANIVSTEMADILLASNQKEYFKIEHKIPDSNRLNDLLKRYCILKEYALSINNKKDGTD